MSMKDKYAADKARYSTTDKLIKQGRLDEVWRIHPDNPNRLQVKKKGKTNSVNAQCYVAARTVHRPCHLYTFNFTMNDTEVIAFQPPIEYTMNDNAEIQNGRWAMIGILAALGAYATTGQIIPGIF